MTEALVSVVIPAHNASMTIGQTVDSVLRQTHTRLEVIVVDDGSTDDTAAIAQASGDPRVRLVRRPAASGVCAARNAGYRQSSGGFVGFLDADDLWTPDKVASHVRAIERTGFGVAYSYVRSVDAAGRRVGPAFRPAAEGDVLADAVVRCFFGCGSNFIARRAVLDAVPGPFAEDLRHRGDWLAQVALARRARFALIRREQVHYRQLPGQMSATAHSMSSEVGPFLERVFAEAPGHAQLRPRTAANLHRFLAGLYLRSQDTQRAGPHLRAAMRLDPGLLRDRRMRQIVRHYLMWRYLPPLVAGRTLDAQRAIQQAVGRARIFPFGYVRGDRGTGTTAHPRPPA